MFSLKRAKRNNQRSPRLAEPKQGNYVYHSKRTSQVDGRAHASDSKEPKSKRSNQGKIINHAPILFIVIGLFMGLFYLSMAGGDPKIVTNKKTEVALRNEGVYKEAAEDFLSESIMNRSKLSFDSQGLVQELKRQFPEIAAVSVTLPVFGHQPVISIQPTRPSFILVSGQEAYLIGLNGVALVSVRDASKDVSTLSLRVINDDIGINLKPGKPALPQEQALFIGSVIEQFDAGGVDIESITIPESPYDLRVKMAGAGYVVKLNSLEDARQQVGNYLVLKQKLEQEGVIPAEYIDVRVGERVFYK